MPPTGIAGVPACLRRISAGRFAGWITSSRRQAGTPAIPVVSQSYYALCLHQALLQRQSIGLAHKPALTGLFSM